MHTKFSNGTEAPQVCHYNVMYYYVRMYYPGGLESIWQYPALVLHYSEEEGAAAAAFVSLLFTAHLITCAQLIN
jgi:hypothetical protein